MLYPIRVGGSIHPDASPNLSVHLCGGGERGGFVGVGGGSSRRCCRLHGSRNIRRLFLGGLARDQRFLLGLFGRLGRLGLGVFGRLGLGVFRGLG